MRGWGVDGEVDKREGGRRGGRRLNDGPQSTLFG